MKTILLALLLAGAMTACAQKNGTATTPTTHVFFLDKSSSVAGSQDVLKRQYRQLFLARVKPHDEVIISFLYGNTDQKSNVERYRFTPPSTVTDDMTPKERERAEEEDALRVKQTQLTLLKRTENYAFGNHGNGGCTYIRGSVPLLAHILQNVPTGKVNVYLLSDMVESSKGRDLEKKAPASVDEARTMAKEDATAIAKQHSLSGNALQRISCIAVYDPLEGLSQSNAWVHLPVYWQTFFGAFGTPIPRFP